MWIPGLNDSISSDKLLVGRRYTGAWVRKLRSTVRSKDRRRRKEEHSKRLEGIDISFFTRWFRGGMGGGATTVVARLAREAGALVFAFTPLPFSFRKKVGMLKLRDAWRNFKICNR